MESGNLIKSDKADSYAFCSIMSRLGAVKRHVCDKMVYESIPGRQQEGAGVGRVIIRLNPI